MEATITTASAQWASRPDDQRYLTMAELGAAVKSRRGECWTTNCPVRNLRGSLLRTR